MIGVVTSRPVNRLALVVAHRVVIGDRDGLVVRDEKAELPTGGRRQWAPARIGAGLVNVDRRAAAALVSAGVVGRPFLVGAPAEFGGLHAFRQEAVDRPGVDEHVARLRALGALRVALSDMHALDPESLRETRPLLLARRLALFVAKIP